MARRDHDSCVKGGEEWKSGKRAHMEHGVPRTTFRDRHSGRVFHGSNIGPQHYLNEAEKEELCDFIITGRWALETHNVKLVTKEF